MKVDFHRPVMIKEVLFYLNPRPGGVYLDCTVGGGGHSLAILEKTLGKAKIIGLDMDPEAIAEAKERLAPFGKQVMLFEENFIRSQEVLSRTAIDGVDGLICDLGVSSWQLEQENRGFSFRLGGPLDMRMNPKGGFTASEILNNWSQRELENLLLRGEVPYAKKIAEAIVVRRKVKPLQTTSDLVSFIEGLRLPHRRTHDPSTLLFQALRITVNRELENLTVLISSLPQVLKPKGRAVFLSYHSLEDRIIKKYFNDFQTEGSFHILTRKVVRPQAEEIESNRRSRSARLRAVERNLQ